MVNPNLHRQRLQQDPLIAYCVTTINKLRDWHCSRCKTLYKHKGMILFNGYGLRLVMRIVLSRVHLNVGYISCGHQRDWKNVTCEWLHKNNTQAKSLKKWMKRCMVVFLCFFQIWKKCSCFRFFGCVYPLFGSVGIRLPSPSLPPILRSSCRKRWNNPHEVWQGEISLCATCKESAKGSRWFSWAIVFNIWAKMTIFVWVLVSDPQGFKKVLCITDFVKGFHIYLMLKLVFMFNVGAWNALNDSEAMFFLA